MPGVTVIIAVRPDQAEIKAVTAARKLDYPPDKLDIVVARGRQPSVQRNVAMKDARTDWIYFLDDDSVPESGNLRRAVQWLNDPAVKMIGGPNLCPPDAPALEQIFAVVLASWLAFGPSRARYTPVGASRTTSEKELILCNLMARRHEMLELEGFNEALYPNEENAMMDELQKRGGRLMYDPEFVVHRRPRHSLKAFAKMLRTYGRGRAEQFREHPTLRSAPNFVPPLFLLYLVIFGVFVLLPSGMVPPVLMFLFKAILALYAGIIVLQTLVAIPSHGLIRSLLAMPLLVASHIFYGYGFWRGLFTKLQREENRRRFEVVLERH